MLYWLLAVVVVVAVVLISLSVRKRKANKPPELQTHKQCSFCKEDIPINAAVCKYCGRVVISSG